MSIQVIKEAIKLSCKDSKNMQRALAAIAHSHGWTREEAPAKFVQFCVDNLGVYQPSEVHRTYVLRTGSDAERVAVFVDWFAGDWVHQHVDLTTGKLIK